jgi:predicted transglutaminase-like cysteine proteinase
MKLFTSVKRIFLHSIVLLFAFCSLLLTVPTAFAASTDLGTAQYIAFNATASAPTQTVQDIEELIQYYRDQKLGISKNDKLTIEQKKEQLKNINSEINALIKDREALAAK